MINKQEGNLLLVFLLHLLFSGGLVYDQVYKPADIVIKE